MYHQRKVMRPSRLRSHERGLPKQGGLAVPMRGILLRRERRAKMAPAMERLRIRRVEAVLFLAREPLSSKKLADYAGLPDGNSARRLVKQLNSEYDLLGRTFRAEEIAGGFQLLTRERFAPWLARTGGGEQAMSLSAPAMETLAVVAYRQPVQRADVEAVRGVACGELLRQLMDRELVRIRGRSHDLGRPYLYGTTKKFLRIFGLKSLELLPLAETMCNNDAQEEESGNFSVISPEE